MADDFGPDIPGCRELPKDSSYPVLLAERGLTAVPKAQGYRRIYTRFDKIEVMFLAFLNFALIVEMIYDLE